MTWSRRARLNILWGTTIVALVATMLVAPIPQDPAYHEFADQRELRGIPNFWNVITNVPFLVAGLMGFAALLGGTPRVGIPQLRPAYLTFFIGMSGVALGSSYYHLDPSNETLAWDRLPMTISFMAFCSIIVGDRLSVQFGKRVLWPLVFFGVMSVVYWSYTENLGRGDLRPYAVVQFLPGLLIPMILLMFPSKYSDDHFYWAMIACYVLAKIAEALDEPIFTLLRQISGHSIKHLIASAGGFIYYWMLINRISVAGGNSPESASSADPR